MSKTHTTASDKLHTMVSLSGKLRPWALTTTDLRPCAAAILMLGLFMAIWPFPIRRRIFDGDLWTVNATKA